MCKITPTYIAGARGSGKTTALIERVRGLLAVGVPARRIMVVTFSPRAAARIAAHLPAQIDAEAAGGLRLQTASRLCMRLLAECYRARSGSGADGDGRGDGESDPPRLLSAIERATILHAAARRSAATLGPSHPLTPLLSSTGGLAEIGLLLDAVAGQGGQPDELHAMARHIGCTAMDRNVLEGITILYRDYRELCERVHGITYQEVAARTASLLADPAVSGPIARCIDHLLIDDLDRAEPAQVAVLARIATRAQLFATVDPAALVSDRAQRAADLARDLLGLDTANPTCLLPPPARAAALARMCEKLGDTPHPSPRVGPSPSPSRGEGEHHVSPLSQRGEAGSPLAGREGALVVAEMALDTEEAAYVAHAARAAVAEAAAVSGGEGEGRPDVLIVVPDPALHEPLLAALRAEDIVAVDTIGSQSSYDPAVRYVLAWLRVLGDHSDEQWERVLASPLARLPAADLARLREWAIKKRLTLDAALRATAGGDGPSIADTARSRLAELARLLDELRHSARYEGYEAPSVTLHRLLARDDLVEALLVGPSNATGAVAASPAGLAGLCDLMARLERLWPELYGRPATLGVLLERLEDGLAHLLERRGAPETGRVVLTDLAGAAGWHARVVIVPGLCDRYLPCPRARSALLSDGALAALRMRWTLPWPAGFAGYAAGERYAFAAAVAAAHERVVLTRARRYDGEDALVPSPLLLDALDAARVSEETCRAAGARYDDLSGGAATSDAAGDLSWPLLTLTPGEAARRLDTIVHRHARRLAEAALDSDAAARFLDETRAILADLNAPSSHRYLTLDDPFAPLPAGASTLAPGRRISTHALRDYLACPRRFFYGTQASIPHGGDGISFGTLVGKVARALHRNYPDLADITPRDVEELLRLFWEGETPPDGEQVTGEEQAEQFANRFGPLLQAQSNRVRALSQVRRLAAAKGHTALARHTRGTEIPIALPIELPNGRKVYVTGRVDRMTEKSPIGGRKTLSLLVYSSGGADPKPANLIGRFLNRDGKPDWRPEDYTLPVLFLGMAGNRALYKEHGLPGSPVRELAVVSLGRDNGGTPAYGAIQIDDRGAGGQDRVTVDELRELRQTIAETVAAAAAASYYDPAPARAYDGCANCAYRFACPGPEAQE